jgi:cytochrome P450 family 3 subfamily A
MRKTMTPSFTSGKMKAMMTILNDCVDDLVESLDEKASNQQDLNSIDTFGFYTMDVVARCVFAAITNVQKLGYDSEFMQKAARFLSRTFLMEKSMMVLSLLLPKSIFDVLMTLSQKADDVGYLEKIVLHIASQRTQEVRERSYKDLLQLLLDVNQNEMPRTKTTGNLMSNDELVANSLIVLGAGQETPAALLTYMSLILAKHQDIQNRLRKEIRKWYENAGNKFKYEDLTILPYLDAVVSETLRMYPPAVRFERTCTKDYSTEAMIGGRRVRLDIKKGDHIRIPIYAIHHDPVNHNDPEQYKPERFLLQNRDNLIPYTYLPFGTGPRACIGMRFALIEVKLALAKLILKFKFTLSRRTPKALDFSNVFALLSPKNVIVGIEKVSIEDEGHTTNDD